MHFRRILFVAAIASLWLPLVGPAHAQDASLSGRFAITAGACEGQPSGSFFRMILPTGSAEGPFVSNSDSGCGDKTFTVLAAGDDGGLILGAYQAEPSPAFDGSGNSLAKSITKPTKFFGVDFSTSTNGTDPQTKAAVPPPSLTAAGDGSLSGDLRAFAASWNNQEFNQGAPKPDGSLPGLTAPPSGHLDPQTGAFTLEWRSQIVGGPFDRFTGVWHLEGTYTPDSTPTTAAAQSAPLDSSVPDQASSPAVSTAGSATPPPVPSSTAPALSSSPAAAGATASTGQVGTAAKRSPNAVTVRADDGGSNGKAWIAGGAAVTALGVGGLTLRQRVAKRRRVES